MSGNHRRKRKEQWCRVKRTHTFTLLCFLDTLGLKSVKKERTYAELDKRAYWYTTRIYEKKRSEQRL